MLLFKLGELAVHFHLYYFYAFKLIILLNKECLKYIIHVFFKFLLTNFDFWLKFTLIYFLTIKVIDIIIKNADHYYYFEWNFTVHSYFAFNIKDESTSNFINISSKAALSFIIIVRLVIRETIYQNSVCINSNH